jgi:signal transduction histidine kinase
VTIRTRLTFWYGLTFMLLLAIAGLIVWWQVDRSLYESLEDELRIRATDVAVELTQGDDVVDLRAPVALGIFTLLQDPDGGIADASPGAPRELPDLPEGSSRAKLADDGPTYAFYSMALADGRQLTTGASLSAVEIGAAQIPESLLGIGAAGAVASLLGGWWLAGRALAPMRELTEEANAIEPQDLARRLPSFPQRDEVGRLAATLNRLLARVEAGVLRERAFIAGAAHDLRTPVASLRVRLDALAQGTPAGSAEYGALDEVRRDALNLSELADDLLGLAEAQAAGPADEIEELVLPLLVSRAEQEVEWLAHERHIRIQQAIDEESVRISAVRFHQALTNLLANAVRHGPAEATVYVVARVERAPAAGRRASADDGAPAVVAVEVADQGPGIDAADRDDLFAPFGSRRGAARGHGLGLAIAAAAVRSQGGQIGYRVGTHGGSVFWFRLPITPAE